ncbi:MAG TPA: two-component regulator propeller domain-containing protein [Paludibacteraceae bacterium]|nr:two-component regulator propeller domain-containing protein [Paludibacteraceae bacterium]
MLKYKNLFFVVFFLILSFTLPVWSLPSYQFKHYDINKGLSQNTVLSILQDKQGFMWFGTKHGLNRFDGKSFKVFKFFPNSEVKDNVFRCILQDKDEKLWLGTDEGVYIYEPRSEKFQRFVVKTTTNDSVRGVVSDMIIDSEGDIWISVEEKGVYLYRYGSNTLDHFPVKTPLGGLKKIKLCENKGKGVWAFPYSMPFLQIDKKSRKIQPLFSLNQGNEILYNTGEIGSVIEEQNNLLVGTSLQGLLQINLVERTYNKLLASDETGQPIFVRNILRKGDDLWVATESGIYIYNLYSREVINLRHNNVIPYSLSDNAVYSLYEDNEGGVWMGTYFGGVNYFPNRLTYFEIFYPLENENSIKGRRVREFCENMDGRLWIGTEDNGLNLFDPETSQFLPIDSKLNSLYHNIHALFRDGNILWIGTFSKGLNCYNLKTKTLKTYYKTSQSNSLSENSVFSICKDRNNTLWIGTLSGLNTYDYKEDSFTRIKKLEGAFVQNIFEDSEGNIWVATFVKGLYKYDPSIKIWKNYVHTSASGSLPYNKITSVYEDSKKSIWITTEGGGFCQYDKKNDTFITWNSSNGLPNDVVYQIKEDNFGNLWLTTNAGLVQFDPEKKSFKNFTVEDGLKTNQFNYKSSYKAPDGTLYFGSIDGFIRFNPAYFKENNILPPIVLTDFYLNNLPANVSDKGSPLKESISYAQKIQLPYNKNSFTIHYAILNYSGLRPKNVVYKLEGFDKQWIPANGSQSVVYSNLNPGKYRLIISFDTNSSGGVNKVSKTLDIIIKPPFWETWWAYLLYFLIIITGIFELINYFRQRTKRIHLEKMRDFEQEKEKELYESKIDFFTNVAHEIRTPLSLIKAPLDQILRNDETVIADVKDNLKVMSKNTDRLMDLTNQLLDFRKTEAELYKLKEKRINLSELMKETFDRFTPLAKQKNISFSLKLPEKEIVTKIDAEAFTKIISNLINNAVKYCNGMVNISLEALPENHPEKLIFKTENDGAVIPEKFKNEIFKPFTRLNKEKDKIITGTGIGLTLTKSLIELLKGTISYQVENNLNVFKITLPIKLLSEKETIENKRESDEILEKLDKEKIQTSKKQPSLLLVEDDKELKDFLVKCLKNNYNVFISANGKEALEILKEKNIDLVISDVMMPEMDGFELTSFIKSHIEYSHIPVILLTAKVNVQSKVQGFEVGADAYIEKPFSVEVLLAQVASILQNREKFREIFLKNPFKGFNNAQLNKSDEEFLQKLEDIIQENIANPDFNIEDLAEQFFMSRASFYRKIKGILDLTPNEYLRVARLKKAAQLLKEGNYRVTEICYMVGFNSPSYFAKCFQQQFGVLPKDFS